MRPIICMTIGLFMLLSSAAYAKTIKLTSQNIFNFEKADKYIVSSVIDLVGQNITLPDSSLLVFKRLGCIVNGSIEGNDIYIKSFWRRTRFGKGVLLKGNRWKAKLAYSEWFGVVANCILDHDGKYISGTDNYQPFQNLLKFNNVEIQNGVYYVDGNLQTLCSNQKIEGNGATIKGRYRNRFAGILTIGSHYLNEPITENVTIQNLSLIGMRYEAEDKTQWAHGIVIKNARDIKLKRITCSYCKGDGFNIAETFTDGVISIPMEIELEDCKSIKNYRCGLSITGGSDIRIRNSSFNYTIGQDPQCGIDIEPNEYKVADGGFIIPECKQILIDNCVFEHNNRHSVKIEAPKVCDELNSFPITTVTIQNSSFANNGISIWRVDSLAILNCDIKSDVATNGIVFQNATQQNVLLESINIYNNSQGKPEANGIYISPGHTRHNLNFNNITIKGNLSYGFFIPSHEKHKGTITNVSFNNISCSNGWNNFFVGSLVKDANYDNIKSFEVGTSENGHKYEGWSWGWSVHKHNE